MSALAEVFRTHGPAYCAAGYSTSTAPVATATVRFAEKRRGASGSKNSSTGCSRYRTS